MLCELIAEVGVNAVAYLLTAISCYCVVDES